MSLSREKCVAKYIAPVTEEAIRRHLDALLGVLATVCPDYTGDIRDDGCWIFVPSFRETEPQNRNLLTIKLSKDRLAFNIRPLDGWTTYEPARLAEYTSLIRARYEQLQALG